MRHIPKAYERYRHFKGNCYQILAIAKDSEDASEQVVYQALYPPFDIYVRPLSVFMSEVDHTKYPSVTQRFRFELVSGGEQSPQAPSERNVTETFEDAPMKSSEGEAAKAAERPAPEGTGAVSADCGGYTGAQPMYEQQAEESDAEGKVDENVMAFLDADTYEQKLKIFSAIHDKVTQEMLNTIAVSLDIEVGSGELEERYRQIQNCLMTFQKYECSRLR